MAESEEKILKAFPGTAVIIGLAVCILAVAVFGRELGSREAREKIAAALGLDKPDRVHIKSVKPGAGGEAIVEAQFDAAFRFAADKEGKWAPVEVRSLPSRARLLPLRGFGRSVDRQSGAALLAAGHQARCLVPRVRVPRNANRL